jgi:hypothetical protein
MSDDLIARLVDKHAGPRTHLQCKEDLTAFAHELLAAALTAERQARAQAEQERDRLREALREARTALEQIHEASLCNRFGGGHYCPNCDRGLDGITDVSAAALAALPGQEPTDGAN